MRVGFYSPMPPARTGVADYSASLLAVLRPLADVKVNAPGDVCLYHAGNNHMHREIYKTAVVRPGVVVLHDAVLHHFFLGTLAREQYIEEFLFNYGDWSRSLAEALWRERAQSASDPRYFEYAMLRRIAETSRAVIVHNPEAAAMVRAHAPAAQVCEIPHLFNAAPPVPLWEIERVRESWGIRPGTFVFGIFGHLRESKRLASCLRAFEVVRAEHDCALLVCGDFASEDLEREMKSRLGAPGIIRMTYVEEHSFQKIANAVDACLNLRYPAAGETSGIGVRLMGAGKPVIVTAGKATSRIPGDACLRVDSGLAEQEMLARFMQWLAAEPHCAREIGRRAAAYIRDQHDPGKVASMYLDVLNAVAN